MFTRLICSLLLVVSCSGLRAEGLAVEEVLQGVRAVIFDMDGVLRCGSSAIPGAGEMVSWMRRHEVPGLILTNECRYTPARLRVDLHNMGIPVPENWPIYTAALAMRDFFQHPLISQQAVRVLVIGEEGLKEAMQEVEHPNVKITETLEGSEDEDLYVAIGSVNEVTIEDLEQAMMWIRAGAKVITTCPDAADPASKGTKLIGMPYHFVAMLRSHAPCTPYCVGKPNPSMMWRAKERLQDWVPGLNHEEILFLGDSMNTDIQLGFEAGVKTALVLSGNTRVDDVKRHVLQPDVVVGSVKDLLAGYLLLQVLREDQP